MAPKTPFPTSLYQDMTLVSSISSLFSRESLMALFSKDRFCLPMTCQTLPECHQSIRVHCHHPCMGRPFRFGADTHIGVETISQQQATQEGSMVFTLLKQPHSFKERHHTLHHLWHLIPRRNPSHKAFSILDYWGHCIKIHYCKYYLYKIHVSLYLLPLFK